jgi:hypothetical protein
MKTTTKQKGKFKIQKGMENYNSKVDSAGNYRRYQLLSYRFPYLQTTGLSKVEKYIFEI